MKISELSQYEHRTEDLIACSLYSLYIHVMRNPLKRMAAYICKNLVSKVIHTHYHNSNLILRTVSRRLEEVIPTDHPRRYPMVWPDPREMILNARSSYYYDDMFIICLFLTFILILVCFGI